MNNIIKSWNGRVVRIREDRYVSLTDMAQACGKKLGHWNELKSSKSYLEALSSVIGIPATELVQINQGGTPDEQGTWGHPKVALRFAQWCSDSFAVQVDLWVDELLTTGKVELQPSPPPPALPKRDSVEYAQAAKIAEDLKNPIIKSLIEQRLMEELTPTDRLLSGADTKTHVIATVRAQELGYSAKAIGSGAQLGKFILKQGIHPVGKAQHGRYPVNVYELSQELDRAIHAYFS